MQNLYHTLDILQISLIVHRKEKSLLLYINVILYISMKCIYAPVAQWIEQWFPVPLEYY